LTSDLQRDGYHWKSDYLCVFPVPYSFPYLISGPDWLCTATALETQPVFLDA